eukprot:1291694-Alexandrium_andersonii.AAC.1
MGGWGRGRAEGTIVSKSSNVCNPGHELSGHGCPSGSLSGQMPRSPCSKDQLKIRATLSCT